MKNLRIRKELFLHDMTQGDLGRLLGMPDSDISKLLKYELAKSEQDEIIRKIREQNTEPA